MNTPQFHPHSATCPGGSEPAFAFVHPPSSFPPLRPLHRRASASALHPSSFRLPPSSSGVALILTLSILVLITILVVGFATIMTTERSVARAQYESEVAKAITLNGRDLAVARLRASIDAGSVANKIWASQPGRISVFDIVGNITVDSSVDGDLYSKSNLSSGNNTGTVNLNQAGLGGSYPIAGVPAGNTTAPVMDVEWVNVLRDGTSNLTNASVSNPVAGRYAFWVDDESAKVNYNTASGVTFDIIKTDGTGDWNADTDGDGYADPTNIAWSKAKAGGTATWDARSDGAGQPTEVDLTALSNFTQSLTANLTARARQLPFLEPRGMLALSGGNASVYEENKFGLTHYSRSPELNFFGEPKIMLFPARINGAETQSYLVGLGGSPGIPLAALQQYPTTSQLGNFSYKAWAGNLSSTAWGNSTSVNLSREWPSRFVQKSSFSEGWFSQRIGITSEILGGYDTTRVVPLFDSATENYALGALIAQYISGRNSANSSVSWPGFQGAAAGANLGSKYNARQVDSIALQILDIMQKGVLTELPQTGNTVVPSFLPKGWLSGEPVMGISRGPLLSEVLLEVETTPDTGGGDGPRFRVNQLTLEFYFPEGVGPSQISSSFFGQFALGDGITITGNTYWRQYFNNPEARGQMGPDADPGTIGYQSWWDNMWSVVNDLGNTCVDLRGAPKGNATAPLKDPDQTKASNINRPIITGNTSDPNYGKRQAGGQHSFAPEGTSLLQVYNPDPATPTDNVQNRAMLIRVNGSPFAQDWRPGQWKTVTIRKNTNFVDMGADTFGITMSGGLSFWLSGRRPNSNDNSRWTLWEAVPLDSLGGVPWVDGTDISSPTNATIANRLKLATLQFPQHEPIDVSSNSQIVYYHWYVRDPMVNKFPGDWISSWSLSSMPGNATLGAPPSGWTNPATSDNRALAWSALDPSGTVRRTQRLPSVGVLSRIRTGIIPDNLSANLTEQKGVPFRTLNFAPSTDASQTNPGTGISYPDWALLDLFTVPGVANIGQTSVGQRFTNFTSGGATAGRINPNSVIVPFSTVTRNTTLAAAFKSLSTDATILTNNATLNGTTDWNAGASVNETSIAAAIDDYIRKPPAMGGLGRPLAVAGELANVPAIANYTNSLSVTLSNGTAVTVRSRNDLLMQSIGHFNTQSNTFSVWAVSQSISKVRSNTNYDQVEIGDRKIGESRMRFIVERYLDLGTDDFAGNKVAPGPDGQPGTLDDVKDPQLHPRLTFPLTGNNTALLGDNVRTGKPQYKYRVVYAEQVD